MLQEELSASSSWVYDAVTGMTTTEDQYSDSLSNFWDRQKARWAGGSAVLRLRALHVLAQLQLMMFYITCLSPSLFGLAVRHSLSILVDAPTHGYSLWEQDRSSRAQLACLFSDLGIW